MDKYGISLTKRFLSTPSARRATLRGKSGCHAGCISIHALREEGDGRADNVVTADTLFLSTPSVRRATQPRTASERRKSISIHALREEGDAVAGPCGSGGAYFYPRPPRGGRLPMARVTPILPRFLSTPSVRRATWNWNADC